MPLLLWILTIVAIIVALLILVASYDAFFQDKDAIKSNFPLIGRFRYFFYDLRPFFRQYFGDDNAFTPRIIIDWIEHVARGKKGYFSFDTFDSSGEFRDDTYKMVHAPVPYNNDEMDPQYPLV